jgi:hypothetical protein
MRALLFALGELACLVLLAVLLFLLGADGKHKGGWIGSLYGALFVRLPDRFSAAASARFPWLFPPDPTQPLRWRHLLSALFVCGYAYLLFEYYRTVWPALGSLFKNPQAMRVLSCLVTPWPIVLFVVFQFADPGVITASNLLAYLAVYPPDGKLYEPSYVPGTEWPVVPRSGYCSWTRRWVARYDHYCPWVGRPIGERTIRLFLLFLISSWAVAIVGSIGFLKYFWCFRNYNRANRQGIMKFLAFAALGHGSFTASMTSTIGLVVVLAGIFFRTCFECSQNMNTNERAKQKTWQSNHPGEKFVNAYDKGFLANWKGILWPPYVAKQAPHVLPTRPSTEAQNGTVRRRARGPAKSAGRNAGARTPTD